MDADNFRFGLPGGFQQRCSIPLPVDWKAEVNNRSQRFGNVLHDDRDPIPHKPGKDRIVLNGGQSDKDNKGKRSYSDQSPEDSPERRHRMLTL